jgi:hypothetical protein
VRWLGKKTEKRAVLITEHFEFFSTQLANKPSSSLPIPILADENDFIERLKSHDECAFETMVRRHGTRMLATACKILGNEHDAATPFSKRSFLLSDPSLLSTRPRRYRPGCIV